MLDLGSVTSGSLLEPLKLLQDHICLWGYAYFFKEKFMAVISFSKGDRDPKWLFSSSLPSHCDHRSSVARIRRAAPEGGPSFGGWNACWHGGGKERDGPSLWDSAGRASHQLSGGPLTSQPILNVGLDSSQNGVGHGHLCSYNLGSERYRSFYAFRVFPEAFRV